MRTFLGIAIALSNLSLVHAQTSPEIRLQNLKRDIDRDAKAVLRDKPRHFSIKANLGCEVADLSFKQKFQSEGKDFEYKHSSEMYSFIADTGFRLLSDKAALAGYPHCGNRYLYSTRKGLFGGYVAYVSATCYKHFYVNEDLTEEQREKNVCEQVNVCQKSEAIKLHEDKLQIIKKISEDYHCSEKGSED
jgi:hypothetical protein